MTDDDRFSLLVGVTGAVLDVATAYECGSDLEHRRHSRRGTVHVVKTRVRPGGESEGREDLRGEGPPPLEEVPYS